MFAKALASAADSLIIDLEDAVTPDSKAEVRNIVSGWLANSDFGSQERLVRVNPLDSPWGKEDLEAIMSSPPDGIVLPKVCTFSDIEAIDEVLSGLENDAGVGTRSVPLILIGTELAAAVFNLPKMACHPRVGGVTWGAEDLSASLGARTKRDANGEYLEVFRFARSVCLLSAVGAGVQPIDTVYVDFRDTEGLSRECELAADMGFTGKMTIHPSQIDIVNQAFSPTQTEVEEAVALLQAFTENAAQGRMAFTFRGEMVDVAHQKRAQVIVERAQRQQS